MTVDFDSDLPEVFKLKALFWVSYGLLAHHHLDAGFASLIPVSIIKQAWIYQQCWGHVNPYPLDPALSDSLPRACAEGKNDNQVGKGGI